MTQTELSTADATEVLDASLPDTDLIFGMLGIRSENCPAARGYVSPVQTEALYDLASRLYAAGEYKDADTLFQMLCCYKNNDPRFWMGLGGCRQALGDARSAVEAYMATCNLQGFTSPQPLFFSAMCLLRLNMREASMNTLRFLTQLNHSATAADRECCEKAHILLEALQTEMEKAQ